MIEAELPDGTVLEFPDGTPPDVVQRTVRKRLGVIDQTVAKEPANRGFLAEAADAFNTGRKAFQSGARNAAAGLVRGAGSIGATLLTPIDAAARAMGVENDFIGRNDRRQMMDEGLRSLGADPDSIAYQGGKIAGEIAGTAGAGGAAANVITRVAPGVASALPATIAALRSSGMSAAGATGAKALAARVAGGAAAGGLSAGMVNPEDAGTGALIGGALPLATKAAGAAIQAGRKVVGTTTGVGDDALRVAYESGRAGGPQAQAFRDNMRGNVNMMDVLDDARANLDTMRQAKSAAYRQNMAAVKADKSVLDMTPIDQSIQDSINRFTFKGQARNPQVLKALEEVTGEVNTWKQLDPTEFHTPEGLDALKQRIGAIRQNVPFEARDVRAAIDGVYNSVKKQIETQAPNYSKAMREYAQASELLDEITRSLSLGEKSTADTAMRKLQSVMRNNVNTNYGARMSSLEALEQQGGRQMVPALAGQALNDWAPRGIQRATGAIGAGMAGVTAGLPAAAGAAAVSSPRLMGEAAYMGGVTARELDPIIRALRRSTYYGAPVLGAQ